MRIRETTRFRRFGVQQRGRGGFNLTELLVVLAIITILAGLLLPTLGKAREQGRRAVCLNNHKQLITAWNLYAADCDLALVRSGHPPLGVPPEVKLWFFASHGNVDTRTNKVYLVDQRYAAFSAYIRNAAVYKCPSDKHTVGPRKVPTTYSYTMNSYMAPVGIVSNMMTGHRKRVYHKINQIEAPAERFLFIDGNPQSICCPAFMVQDEPMDSFFHVPGVQHGHGAVVSFVDGHAVRKKWLDRRTAMKVNGDGLFMIAGASSPRNPDVRWIQKHGSGPR